MQQKMWLSLTLGMRTILGMPSCAIDDSPHVAEIQTQQAIKIIGAATPYPVLQLLVNAYPEKQTGIIVTFLSSSQSPASIAGMKEKLEKLADIGIVTRSPKLEEETAELQYHQLIRDALIVGVHPSVEIGDYQMAGTLGIVYRKNPFGAVANFLDFLWSAEGTEILDKAGFSLTESTK